jgi:hypothetical protein
LSSSSHLPAAAKSRPLAHVGLQPLQAASAASAACVQLQRGDTPVHAFVVEGLGTL